MKTCFILATPSVGPGGRLCSVLDGMSSVAPVASPEASTAAAYGQEAKDLMEETLRAAAEIAQAAKGKACRN